MQVIASLFSVYSTNHNILVNHFNGWREQYQISHKVGRKNVVIDIKSDVKVLVYTNNKLTLCILVLYFV